MTQPGSTGRRRFLKNLVVISSAAVAGSTLASCTSNSSSTDATNANNSASASPAGWMPVGVPGDLKLDKPNKVGTAAGPVFLVETAPGKVRALLGKCTHRGCAVAWNAGAKEFICPCHGGRYRLDGTNISGPPKLPLADLPVRVDAGGVIQVQMTS